MGTHRQPGARLSSLSRPRNLSGTTIGHALSLFGTTTVTSAFGFVFWLVATHEFPERIIGGSSAVLSAMQLLSTAAMLGLGTFLIGELASGRSGVATLLSTAGLASGTVGVGLGAVFAVVAGQIAQQSFGALNSPIGLCAFCLLVGMTASLLVIDSATIGLSRSGWQFWRNVIYSVLKVALLPVFASAAGTANTEGPVLAWLLGTLLSVPPLLIFAQRGKFRWLGRPNLSLIRRHGRVALLHHSLNVAGYAPRMVLPVFVAAVLGPAANASFYVAVLLAGFTSIVPSHLATALFAVGSGDRRGVARELRRTLAVSAAVSAASVVVFGLGASALLGLFGSRYRSAVDALMLLGILVVPTTVRAHYVAICRVNGDLHRCALMVTGGCVLELALSLIGLLVTQSITVTAGCWVGAVTLQAVLTWPVVAAAGSLPGQLSSSHLALLSWLAPESLRRRS